MLTAKAVAAAAPRERAYKLGDAEGLYLFVSPAGAKSWRANYSVAGKQKTRTYGQYPGLSLADAREAHRLTRSGVAAGTMTPAGKPKFKAVAQDWMDKHLPGLTNAKHRKQVENTLERWAYPGLGEMPIDQIPRTLLVEVVKGIQDLQATGDQRVETAHRVAGRITAVFDHALDSGVIDTHPAHKLSRVLVAREVKDPMPSVPAQEAGDLLRAIDAYPEPVTRMALQLMAYTFPRVSELLGFRKDELREDGAVWVVPPERVKGRRGKKLPHVIPMAPQARALVATLSEMSGCELVIESSEVPGHPLSENTLLFALYRLGYKGRMTVHGFRALASTMLNESGAFPHDVIERQLAHKETDAVRAAYNRAEYLAERRKMMAWYAGWLDEQRAARP